MSLRLLTGISAAALLFGGVAIAQTSGTTSGTAAGKNVEPSAATQKQEGRSADEMQTPSGAGAPGVEAKPGSQSGAMPKSNMDSNSK
ncbi:conserved exported protein of unknown function [Methylocella tundrae]|uniref:Uncharacterized protein n=1 Tax=Methylocella tundrae TaxID=227605 RepID=A0A4U8YXH9_METTU|nr:hypothetical protein [Methylocella tundrae]VFU08171.1 conserved exported protein of unknown function [Methylocella tundrae]